MSRSTPTLARHHALSALLLAGTLLPGVGCSQRRTAMRPVYTPLPPTSAPATIGTVQPSGQGFEDGGILVPADSPPTTAPAPTSPGPSNGDPGLAPGSRGTEDLNFPKTSRRILPRRSTIATRRVQPRLSTADQVGRYLSPTAARDRPDF